MALLYILDNIGGMYLFVCTFVCMFIPYLLVYADFFLTKGKAAKKAIDSFSITSRFKGGKWGTAESRSSQTVSRSCLTCFKKVLKARSK